MSGENDSTTPEGPASGASRPVPGGRGLALLLLAAFAGFATWGAWVKSETYDEPMYVMTAYSYVTTGDLSLNREHPPLAKYLMGLPLLLLDLELPDDYQERPGLPFGFISHQPRADHQMILFLARMPGVLLGLLLGLYVLRWGTVAFGPRAGLAALALYALNPNMLAHSRVAGNDFAVTVFCFAATYHVWRWLSTDAQGSLGWGAITLGLALGSKLTALMLLPVLGGIILVAAVVRRRPVLLGQGALALLAAVGLLYLLYGGEARSLDDVRNHPRFVPRGENELVFRLPGVESALETVFGTDGKIPMLSLLKGIDYQFEHATRGHPTYLRGEIAQDGFWDFYLVTWLLKNPEALSLLILLGLLGWPHSRRGWVHEACLYGFAALQFIIFSRGTVQLGFKYMLTAVPFLCVAAGRPFALVGRPARWGPGLVVLAFSVACWFWFDEKGAAHWSHALPLVVTVVYVLWVGLRAKRGATLGTGPVLLLVAWALVSVAVRQPNNLMYFNDWGGGPENGAYWSVVGDDFGQDTAALGRWMSANGVEHIHYDYYGTADPEVWGVRSTPTFASPHTAPAISGYVALHVTILMRFPQNYTWLAGLEPVTTINHTIRVYDVGDAQRIDKFFEAASQPLPSGSGEGR